MADNVRQQGNEVMATDDVSGVHFQRVKLALGADGSNDGDVSSANPVPVTIPGVTATDNAIGVPDDGVVVLGYDPGGLRFHSLQTTGAGVLVVSLSSAAQNSGVTNSTTLRVTQGRNGTATLTSAVINASSSGDNTLISTDSGKTIKVYKLFLVAAAACTLTFKSDTTALTGAITLAAGGSIVLDFDQEPWFVGTLSGGFTATLSAAVQISGRIYYIQD